MVTNFTITSLEATRDEGMITVLGVQNRPGVAGKLFGALKDGDISLNTIVQNSPDAGYTNITFTVARDHFAAAVAVCREHLADVAEGLIPEERVGRVTAMGRHFKESSGVAAAFFDVLGKANINILAINANAQALCVFIREDQLDLAARLLRRRFDLIDESV
ncbi:MAG: ACT domain-containing protein [Pseudomonadota bacterium]